VCPGDIGKRLAEGCSDPVYGVFNVHRYYTRTISCEGIEDRLAAPAVAVGAWGRAALLVVPFVAFLTLPGHARESRVEPAA